MEVKALHLIYDKNERNAKRFRNMLSSEKGHLFETKSKSHHLLNLITKLYPSKFCKIIIYLNLDKFTFKTYINLILKIKKRKEDIKVLCFGGKKGSLIHKRLIRELNFSLLFLNMPIDSKVYCLILSNFLSLYNTSSKQIQEETFSEKIPILNIGIDSIIYDVRNTINSIKVLVIGC